MCERRACGRAGKCDEPDEHRRDLPLGGGARCRCRAAHVSGQRPALPPRRAREHGHGLSGAVDVSARGHRLAGDAAHARLSHGGHGAA